MERCRATSGRTGCTVPGRSPDTQTGQRHSRAMGNWSTDTRMHAEQWERAQMAHVRQWGATWEHLLHVVARRPSREPVAASSAVCSSALRCALQSALGWRQGGQAEDQHGPARGAPVDASSVCNPWCGEEATARAVSVYHLEVREEPIPRSPRPVGKHEGGA